MAVTGQKLTIRLIIFLGALISSSAIAIVQWQYYPDVDIHAGKVRIKYVFNTNNIGSYSEGYISLTDILQHFGSDTGSIANPQERMIFVDTTDTIFYIYLAGEWHKIQLADQYLDSAKWADTSGYALNGGNLDGNPSSYFIDTTATTQQKRGVMTFLDTLWLHKETATTGFYWCKDNTNNKMFLKAKYW